jgi:ketosteroid isomerase-like protein
VTDLVRVIFERWERGDFAVTDWADPDIEFVLADGPMPGESRGVAAMAGVWGELLGAWDHLTVRAEEIRDLGDGRVLVLTTNRGRGKTSGLELGDTATHGANLFHVRDGRVARLVLYWDRANAFSDLGLRPPP